MRCLILLLPLLAGLVQCEGDCNAVKAKFNECTRNAHDTYVAAVKAGDDGRPHFQARKTCNYLEEAIETCGNKLKEHGCYSEEEVTKMKDGQIKSTMERIGETVADFDSCKCPSVKAYMNRVKAAEGADVVDCSADPADPADIADPAETSAEGETGGASNVLVGVLLLPLLVVHQL